LVYVTPTPEEERAIAVAERFIAENGYTDAPANRDRMVPELMQKGLPKSILGQMRHATLYPKAYGVSSEQGVYAPGWTVFFELTRGSETLAAVEMSPDLRRVWMSHYEMRGDAPARLLRPRTQGQDARRTRGAAEQGMKQTSVERIGRSQLFPSVRQTAALQHNGDRPFRVGLTKAAVACLSRRLPFFGIVR
jgi:hypothetical protein